ncbi:MAG: FUSC family protein, partial [Hyphomicrobiales bacterium]|nr:FUSC family protein [Hyphomicrobiales bacterium]
MAHSTDQGELAPNWKLVLNAARAAGPPLLFGLRLWASVCLALYVAFWLELDNAYWAGTSAAIVC